MIKQQQTESFSVYRISNPNYINYLKIKVRVSARIKRKPTRYEVSVVTRDEVGAYKPYLWEQSVFEKGLMFR